MVRRVNAEFIPVALKAALVNNPRFDSESRLYAEIGRSKPAPQGICVANSAGKALAWALMFEDDPSVLAFLDHAARRFSQYPDATREVDTERFMRFPGQRLNDVEDSHEPLTVRDSSLSASTQAVMAAEVGHLQLAYDYFGEAALLDLGDLEHNTRVAAGPLLASNYWKQIDRRHNRLPESC